MLHNEITKSNENMVFAYHASGMFLIKINNWKSTLEIVNSSARPKYLVLNCSLETLGGVSEFESLDETVFNQS